mgnify:CR=1 FL=1
MSNPCPQRHSPSDVYGEENSYIVEDEDVFTSVYGSDNGNMYNYSYAEAEEHGEIDIDIETAAQLLEDMGDLEENMYGSPQKQPKLKPADDNSPHQLNEWNRAFQSIVTQPDSTEKFAHLSKLAKNFSMCCQ